MAKLKEKTIPLKYELMKDVEEPNEESCEQLPECSRKQEEEWRERQGVTNKRNEEEGDRGQGATSKEAKVKRQDGFTSCD